MGGYGKIVDRNLTRYFLLILVNYLTVRLWRDISGVHGGAQGAGAPPSALAPCWYNSQFSSSVTNIVTDNR